MAIKNTFLAGILATVPEADRGKAEAEIAALEEGGLRQADYSRLSAEAQAAKKAADDLYAANTDWYAKNQAALGELDTLRTRLGELEANPKVITKEVVPEGVITKKELDAQLNTLEREAVGFFTELTTLSLQHRDQFGEILDVNKLLADKRVQEIGLRAVYQEQFKDQIAAKVKSADDARAEALRKEGYDKARADLASSQHPYPVVGNEPSALDAIEAARSGKTPTVKTVDDMAAEFARLSSVRAGAPA